MPEEYPKHLIPTKDLKLISASDLNPQHHIGVWIKSDVILRDDDGRLNGSAVDLKKIPHYSNNKIPDSIPRDLNIEFDGDYKKAYLVAWKEGDEGILPQNEHFKYEDNRSHYFVQVSDISEYTDTYQKNETEYSFHVNLKHCPTVSNYWHFEFSIMSEGNEVDYSKKKWINDICASIRGNIVQKAKFEI
jgi:hypothetical protein